MAFSERSEHSNGNGRGNTVKTYGFLHLSTFIQSRLHIGFKNSKKNPALCAWEFKVVLLDFKHSSKDSSREEKIEKNLRKKSCSKWSKFWLRVTLDNLSKMPRVGFMVMPCIFRLFPHEKCSMLNFRKILMNTKIWQNVEFLRFWHSFDP